LARRFPEADFLGVDLSASSLEIAQRTAQEEGLPNIRFRQWNLLESELNEGCFDVVLCLGVLHHTANMQSVLGNLREALSESGSLYLWVYGQHGRYRHSLNRRLLRMLMSANPPASDPVELAREFLRSGGQGAVLSDLFGKGPSSGMMEKVLAEPAWIADQFLNPNEAMLTMENLLGLVKEARLEIESWLGLPEKPFRLFGSEALIERYRRLSASEQLIALDLLLKPDRYFLVLQKIPNARVAPR
jgi:SAM-dependent methyltransferase